METKKTLKKNIKNRNLEKTRFEMVKERHKKSFADAIKTGEMDKKMIPLCKFLHSRKNYFTSSSCSGRIVILGKPDEKKKDAYFAGKWHRKVKWKELKESMDEEKKNDAWFKQEPFILHLETNNLENAEKALEIIRDAGVRRYGIQVVKEGKFMIEFQGSQQIALQVKEKGEQIVDDNYLKFMLNKANEKLDKNDEALKRVEKEFKRCLKT